MSRVSSLVTVLGLMLAPKAHAAPESTPPPAVAQPPAPVPTPAAACFPACREGFVCHDARCVSLCNPPCPDGQTCVEGRRCEYSPQPGPVYEPPPPRTKAFEERSHALFGFHLGFSGDHERDSEDAELASTYGFNIRSDLPIAGYLVIGPFLQFGAWRPDVSPAPDRSYYIDLDLNLRVRVPLTAGSTNFQIWAGVPIGLTFDFLGEDVPEVAAMGFGWNVGVLFGGAVHFTPRFGLFTEIGWLQHKMTHGADVGQDLDFRLAQWNLNLGLVFKN